MKKIKVEDAINKVLLHDITGTNDDRFSIKKTIYKKGHIIKEEDILILKNSGKNHIYVDSNLENVYHENECALLFVQGISNNNIYYSEITEGKISIYSKISGVLKINVEILNSLNEKYIITLATIKNFSLLQAGSLIASFRIIDLFYNKDTFQELLQSLNSSIFEVIEIPNLKIELLTVGTEIYDNRERDLSLSKLNNKLHPFHQKITNQSFIKDDLDDIKGHLKEKTILNDIIIITGGMSIDPDDLSKDAIFSLASRIICDHTPYLPGSMFNLSIINKCLIIGCPANVVFSPYTILDLLLPRLLINELPTTKEIMQLGLGCL